MEHPQIPNDITRVTEAELRADLTTFLDRVAYAEDELVVMRDGQPVAAVISMAGSRRDSAGRDRSVERGPERANSPEPKSRSNRRCYTFTLPRTVSMALEQRPGRHHQ